MSITTKRLIVARWAADINQELDCRSIRYTGTEELSAKSLEFFIGQWAIITFIFRCFTVGFIFSEGGYREMVRSPKLSGSNETVTALKVENDSADRGIALATASIQH